MSATSQTLDLPTLLQGRVTLLNGWAGKTENLCSDQSLVVAMFNVDMIGHCNPTFALVQELVQRGCKVHYFLPNNESIRAAARDAGATVEGYHASDPDDFALDACGDLDGLDDHEKYSIWPLASTLVTGSHIISRCRQLCVNITVYDPMAPHGLLVAKALDVPCVSLVTFPGLGSIADMVTDEYALHARTLREPLALEVEDKFGVKLDSQMLCRFQWLADKARGDNFVTTIEQLEVPLPDVGTVAWADEIRDDYHMTCVGCMASAKAPHVTSGKAPSAKALATYERISNTFPSQELEIAEGRCARVIFVALGTMALSDRWNSDLGSQSGGNLPPGTTGKAFCHHVWSTAVEAMRELGEEYYCILCIGEQADALDFLRGRDEDQKLSSLPSNVTLRTSIQQVEMLSKHAHAFITHAGFNSLQESLVAGVPLIAVPQAVDQPANARKIESSGWGRSFLQPMTSVTQSGIVQAIRDVAAQESSFRTAVGAASGGLSGGQVRAAERIMSMAKEWTRTNALADVNLQKGNDEFHGGHA